MNTDEQFPYDVTMFWEFFRWEQFNIGHIYLQQFPNGKLYAGQSIRLMGRLNDYSRGQSGSNKHHMRAIKKYGWSNVIVLTISCPRYLLDIIETFLIEYYNLTNPDKGYNKTSGGRKNYSFSKESREKMSVAHTGISHTAEHCKNISAALTNRVFSTEHCANIAASKVGMVHTSESRRKIGAAQKGKRKSLEMRTKLSKSNMGANNSRAIPVCVFGKLFPCGKDASNAVRAEHSPQNSKGNFIWNWTKSKKHKHIAFTVSKEFYAFAIANKLENVTRNFYDNWNM